MLGLFAARSLFVADAICLVMAFGIAFGFCAGIVARLSLLPGLAILDFIAVGLPPVAAAVIKQWDMAHVALALMILVFIVAGVEMVRLSYTAMMNQMTLKPTFEQLARIDPMTGLLNRSALATDFAQVVAESGSAMVAVHAIDLDHFKAANDRYGHPVGDALLKQVASRLKPLAGPADLIVRMGGDEFILVQSSVPSRSDAEATAQRIFEAIGARPIMWTGTRYGSAPASALRCRRSTGELSRRCFPGRTRPFTRRRSVAADMYSRAKRPQWKSAVRAPPER
jgi:diguanylate cyclase